MSDLLVFDIDGTVTKFAGDNNRSLYHWYNRSTIIHQDNFGETKKLFETMKGKEVFFDYFDALRNFFTFLSDRENTIVMIATHNHMIPAKLALDVLNYDITKISNFSIYRGEELSKIEGIYKAKKELSEGGISIKRVIYFEDDFQYIVKAQQKIKDLIAVRCRENLGTLLKKTPVNNNNEFEQFIDRFGISI